MIAQSLLATAVMAASYQYDEQDQWGGVCQDTTFQQSPIVVDTPTVQASSLVTYLDVRWSTDYSYSMASLMTVDGGSMKISTNFEIAEGASGPIAEMKVVLDDGTVEEYVLDGIHTHYGMGEHVIDDIANDGSHHLVFKRPGEDLYSVLEIPFVFDDSSTADMGFYIHKFCGVDDTAIPISTDDYCGNSEAENFGGSAVSPLEMPGKPIYEVFSGGLAFDSSMHANYYGSFTTPPCTGIVQWFPYIGEPVKVVTPENWLYMQSQFPNSVGVDGTYRDVQPVLADTTFAQVMNDPDGTEETTSEPTEETTTTSTVVGPEGSGSLRSVASTTMAAIFAAFL